jgi:hypothetical protein
MVDAGAPGLAGARHRRRRSELYPVRSARRNGVAICARTRNGCCARWSTASSSATASCAPACKGQRLRIDAFSLQGAGGTAGGELTATGYAPGSYRQQRCLGAGRHRPADRRDRQGAAGIGARRSPARGVRHAAGTLAPVAAAGAWRAQGRPGLVHPARRDRTKPGDRRRGRAPERQQCKARLGPPIPGATSRPGAKTPQNAATGTGDLLVTLDLGS